MRTAVGFRRRQERIGVKWGMPCSALFHLAVVALVVLAVPEPRKPKALPKEIAVEIVREKPKKKPEPKKLPAAKPIAPEPEVREKKAAEKPKPSPKPATEPEIKPKAKPKLEAKRSTTDKPVAPKPKVEPAAPKKEASLLPVPKPPQRLKEPQLALAPKPPPLRPKPPAPPKPKLGGTGGKASFPRLAAVPAPNAKRLKLVGQWVLDPLIVDTGHRCGRAQVTGIMNLAAARGGRYLAEIRTLIRWEHCAPGSSYYQGVLAIEGRRVVFYDRLGVLDRGIMLGDVMVLRDKLGNSTWRRRK